MGADKFFRGSKGIGSDLRQRLDQELVLQSQLTKDLLRFEQNMRAWRCHSWMVRSQVLPKAWALWPHLPIRSSWSVRSVPPISTTYLLNYWSTICRCRWFNMQGCYEGYPARKNWQEVFLRHPSPCQNGRWGAYKWGEAYRVHTRPRVRNATSRWRHPYRLYLDLDRLTAGLTFFSSHTFFTITNNN